MTSVDMGAGPALAIFVASFSVIGYICSELRHLLWETYYLISVPLGKANISNLSCPPVIVLDCKTWVVCLE